MKPTVLVVDDDIPILGLMRNVLKEFQFNPITASTGEEAIELAQRENPDVILVDMRMPGMSGDEVIRGLRAVGIDSTPILVLSGAPVTNDELAAMGAAGAIQKPFDLQDLVQRVRSVLIT